MRLGHDQIGGDQSPALRNQFAGTGRSSGRYRLGELDAARPAPFCHARQRTGDGRRYGDG
jgi:hypothetical protein